MCIVVGHEAKPRDRDIVHRLFKQLFRVSIFFSEPNGCDWKTYPVLELFADIVLLFHCRNNASEAWDSIFRRREVASKSLYNSLKLSM